MSDADKWSSLGTKGGHIEIVEYRPDWPVIFQREAAAILDKCRPWVVDVQSVGSTAVPGLAAKPILDILPMVASPEDGHKAVESMTTLGYRYRGEHGLPGRFYFDKIVAGRTVVHAHMYPDGHSDPQKLLAFRDYLRAHPDAAKDYERLKKRLAVKHRDDRRTYTDAKSEYIISSIEAALDSET